MNISYEINEPVSIDEFIDVLSASSLGKRRPIDDRECIAGMLQNSNLIVTARDQGRLIGISRSVTDFYYCCYLSDLAVQAEYQRQGIGVKLQKLTQEQLGPKCKLILLAAPSAQSYYPHIGFDRHESCWVLSRDTSIEPGGSSE